MPTALFIDLWRRLPAQLARVAPALACLTGLLALLSPLAHAGTYYAEVPGHPELVINTATNSPAMGTIWMRCAMGQTWDADAVPPHFPGAKGDCVGTPTRYSWANTTAAVAAINTASFGGYSNWVVPTGSSLNGLFPPEQRQDGPDAWPCTPTFSSPCYGSAQIENDLFRSTPIDEVFWSSTDLFIVRMVGNFASGQLDTRTFSSGNGYLRLMVPPNGQLHDVTVTTDANGSVDTPTRSQLQTGRVTFELKPNPAYQVDQVTQTSGNCVLTTRTGNTLSTTVGTDNCSFSVTFKRMPGVWAITNLNAVNAPHAPNGTLVCQKALVNTGESTQCDFTSTLGYQLTGFSGCDRWASTPTGGSCYLNNVTSDRAVEATALPITSFSGITVPTAGTGGVAGIATASITGAAASWPHCRFDPSETRFEAAPAAPPNQWMPQGQFHYKLIDCNTSSGMEPVVVTLTWPQPVQDLISTEGGFVMLPSLTAVDANTLRYTIDDALPADDIITDTVGPVVPVQYPITVMASRGGSVTCTPNPVNHGDQVVCTTTPDAGYLLTAWGGDCTGAAASCTLASVTAAQTVTAQFSAVQTSFSGSTVPSAGTAAGTATARFTGGGATCSFDVASTAFVAAPATLPAGQAMPHGMLQFKLLGCDTTPVTMAITWPKAVQGLSKWGKASAGEAPSHFQPTGASASGHTTQFTVQDGQLGDDDWTVNGEIVDPVGATVSTSVSVAPVPSLQTWALMALGLLLAVAGTALQPRKA